jgi:2-dehydropantoate 2-reductase
MRILVLGAGAVGGYFGGRLSEAGRDVTFLVRPARAALLRESGLVVTSPLGDFHIPVQTTTTDHLSGTYDVVLLTAKHYGLDEAIEAISPAIGEQTSVLPLLNGLVHLDRLDAGLRQRASAGRGRLCRRLVAPRRVYSPPQPLLRHCLRRTVEARSVRASRRSPERSRAPLSPPCRAETSSSICGKSL